MHNLKLLKIFTLLSIATCFSTAANATLIKFDFTGTSEGGTGSASMTFDDQDFGTSTLNVTLENTSDIKLVDLSGPNTAAITAFGMNLDPATFADVTSWSLTVSDKDGVIVDISNVWGLTNSEQGLSLDLIVNNDQGSHNAIYNSACLADTSVGGCNAALPGGGAGNANYFSTASLMLNFNQNVTPTFNPLQTGQNKATASPTVRLQQVGNGGSLKLAGTPTPMPEPGMLVLLGIGMVGLAGARRRKNLR